MIWRPKPRLFVASASESKKYVEAMQRVLGKDLTVTPWYEGVFGTSESYLESLVNALDKADFAAFFLTADDYAHVRNHEVTIARDNVVFELGLFMGRLGRNKCFAVTLPAADGHHVPSDLAGISVLTIDTNAEDDDAAVSLACATIKKDIESRRSDFLDRVETALSPMLAASARLIALRSSLGEAEIRAFCHIYDARKNCLRPVSRFTGIDRPDDAAVEIPCGDNAEWYVIARAFNQRVFQSGEVDWTSESKNVSNKERIDRNVKSVIAGPIRDPEKWETVIGTIAFDSSKGLDEIRWRDDKSLKNILSFLAETIYLTVTRTR